MCYINLYSYFFLHSITLENDHVIVSLKMTSIIKDSDYIPFQERHLKGGTYGRTRFIESHVLMERVQLYLKNEGIKID